MKKYKCIICDKEFTAEEGSYKFNHALCSYKCVTYYNGVIETHKNYKNDYDKMIIKDLHKLNEIRKLNNCSIFKSENDILNEYYD
jgi:hypothetical protein